MLHSSGSPQPDLRGVAADSCRYFNGRLFAAEDRLLRIFADIENTIPADCSERRKRIPAEMIFPETAKNLIVGKDGDRSLK